ncbi:MAG TPA: thiamine diphosphokinase [Anaerolineales bacterium]|nr:thiamine diphosphokinase [Anaerolineae bacterium]HIQ01915.1 thiamine diphosphokinase [Anaerolineales bacterium]
MRAVIFANGRFPDPAAHRHLLRPDDLVVAADGGAAHARALGVTPYVVIGDLDSLEPDLRAELAEAGAQFLTRSPAKDETDLELALLYAVRQGAEEVLILGALGGRIDQTVANLLLLAHPALAGVRVRVIEGAQTAFLIRDEALIEGRPGDTVSLIPLGGDARGVTAEGLRWPLREGTLRFGPARGVSNILLGRQARVHVREGMLLCVITHHPNPEEEER